MLVFAFLPAINKRRRISVVNDRLLRFFRMELQLQRRLIIFFLKSVLKKQKKLVLNTC